MILPATRKAALSTKDNFYFTGKPCKNNHVDLRRTANGRCEACRLSSVIENKEAIAEYQKSYAAENKDRLKYYKTNYREVNGKELYKKEQASRDPIKNSEYQKKYGPKYREENRALVNFWASNRRSAVIQRKPEWLTEQDNNDILAIYEEARLLTKETGIDHHVDHIVPLQGSLVSGLHTPWNLQVLTANENLTKSNTFRAVV